MTSFIPSEMIFEILLRLPVKSICRFKCVSRSFRDLLTDHLFVRMHLTQSQRRRRFILCLNFSNCESGHSSLYILDPKTSHHDHKFTDLVLEYLPKGRQINLLGSCNGLLLIRYWIGCEALFLVCNPSTKEFKKIPKVQLNMEPFRYMGREWHSSHYGFAHAASRDDYRFVKFLSYHPEKVTIFSLRSNSWKLVENNLSKLGCTFLPDEVGSFLNGAFHWTCKEAICAFDVNEEEWKIFPHPVEPQHMLKNYRNYAVGVVGDCICMLYAPRNPDGKFEFFIMKEYGVKKSWKKIYIDAGTCTSPHLWPPVLPFWKSDGGILLLINKLHRKSLVYFPEDGRSEQVEMTDIRISMIISINDYVESVVSPNYNHQFTCPTAKKSTSSSWASKMLNKIKKSTSPESKEGERTTLWCCRLRP